MNTNKLHIIFQILVFLFIGLFLIILNTWLKKRCLILDCPPKREFTVLDMGIPAGYLPNNYEINLRTIRPIHGAIEESHGGAEWENGYAIYIVLKFGTENQAEDWFEFESQQNFFYPNFPLPNEKESILQHSMLNADQYKIQCGYDIMQNSRCVFYAQYKEFYIFFTGSVGNGQITDEKFIALIDFVDLKISMLLDN